MSIYQIPKPMSTMPIANHPTTPAEMIVSSVMRGPDELGSGFDSESADLITRSKTLDCRTGGHQTLSNSKSHAISFFGRMIGWASNYKEGHLDGSLPRE